MSVKDILAKYTEVWTRPSKNASGSMPIGNGDIGLNLWCEQDGDLLFYISKTDAWSENAELLKIGRVRISFDRNPFVKGSFFVQELDFYNGEIRVRAGSQDSPVDIRIWVYANHPVVRAEIASGNPIGFKVSLELWRTQPRVLEGQEMPFGSQKCPYPVYADVDTLPDVGADRICWYHRNIRSVYEPSLRAEKLDSFLGKQNDPLLNLTFGGCICGEGLVSAGRQMLCTPNPLTKSVISISVLTEQTDTERQYLSCLDELVNRTALAEIETARKAHRDWWHQFWDRSWIWIEGDSDAELAAKSYLLQRYMLACAGRGRYPLKFNGSIFNVDADMTILYDNGITRTYQFGPDWRLWGGPYHWQNTRLPYWTMLNNGDFDMMKPLFSMYFNTLALGKEQTKTYFNHEGYFLIEVVPFWGGFVPYDVSWNIQLDQEGLGLNPYTKYIWHGGFELVSMMLDYYEFTQDKHFAEKTLLAFADEIFKFYDNHWKRDAQGKLLIEPSQAIETWWNVKNPMTDVAGLHFTVTRCLELCVHLATPSQLSLWRSLLSSLPELPRTQKEGKDVLLPAERYDANDVKNIENPELYALFPYRLYGVGKSDLTLARNTYEARLNQRSGGWFQDSIHAACVGLTEQAKDFVLHNCRYKHAVVWQEAGKSWETAKEECRNRPEPEIRFDGFWGPNYDWWPDQDQPSVTMIALQKMLMQTEGKKIFLFPAWPKEWNVRFKLHAPYNTVVEGELCDGVVKHITTTPPERIDDLTCVIAQ